MLDMNLGNVLSRTPILVTCNGIQVQMQKKEWESGGSAPKNIFADHALQVAGNAILASPHIPSLLENQLLTKNTMYA